jgi:hypothetical protein
VWKMVASAEKPKRSKSEALTLMKEKCIRCGLLPKTILEPCFGPYRGKILCDSCWNELNKDRFYRFRQNIDYQLRKIWFGFTGRC